MDTNSSSVASSEVPVGPSEVSPGDTSWVLTSAALVFVMTPGLAFFYGGLVSKKNVLNTIMMSMVCIGVITVQWTIYGYSFAFAPASKWFGDVRWAFLRDVGYEPNDNIVTGIPHSTFSLYQLMFAIITPALISGAIVERVKFSSYIIFVVIWATVSYDMLAHMVWAAGDGIDDNTVGLIRGFGVLDFAGGLAVHTNAGFAALVAAIILGPHNVAHPPTHNVPHVIIGTSLLWFGWFGFNGGSALASGGLASLAFTNTNIAAASAFMMWVILEGFFRKPSVVGACTGAVVGLVAITPAAGYVLPPAAIVIGMVGVLAAFMTIRVREKLQVDDTLDVFCCHGVAGVTGTLLTGVFATTSANEFGNDGVLYGNPELLGWHMAAVLITILITCTVTAVVMLALKYTLGLRPSGSGEGQGLDLHVHGQEAYEQYARDLMKQNAPNSPYEHLEMKSL